MGLDRFLIATVVFILIVVSGLMVIVDVNSSYDDVNIDTSIFEDINITAGESYNLSQSIQNNIITSSVDPDVAEGDIFTKGLSSVKRIFDSFSIVGKMINAISTTLGIPSFFVSISLTILSIYVTFAIIFLVFRVRA